MKKNMKILAFSREVGGAAAIAPVCRAILKEEWDLLLLSKDKGLEFFSKQGLDCVNFPSFGDEHLNEVIGKKLRCLPDIVFTSATSLPWLDMTERYLWRWGQEKGITTVGLLDQWQNYALRFSGCGADEKLTYLPDYIFAMDKLAKNGMAVVGIPEQRIVITGQPAFDRIKEEHKIFSLQTDKIKDRLNIPHNLKIVMFVAESLKKDFGDSLGYDEQFTLQFLGDTLNDICTQDKGCDVYFIVKLHPENVYEEFDWIMSRWPFLKKRIIGKELNPCEAVEISDLVVGMSSTLLIEAILAGKIVVSLQINSRVDSQLVATKVGAIPFIQSRGEGKRVLRSLLCDKAYKKTYMQRQSKWEIKKDSTLNCVSMLKRIMAL